MAFLSSRMGMGGTCGSWVFWYGDTNQLTITQR
jgi:hypothetical protein